LLLGFFIVGVFRYAFYRADLDALRCIEMPDALGALHWIYLVKFDALVNGLVGAFRFADIAIDALCGDLERQ
jgi:hypothetical protein